MSCARKLDQLIKISRILLLQGYKTFSENYGVIGKEDEFFEDMYKVDHLRVRSGYKKFSDDAFNSFIIFLFFS